MSKTQNYWSAEKFSKWVIFHKKNCWPWVNFIQLLQGILNLSKKLVLFSSFWFSVCFGLRYFTPFLIEMFYSKIVLISNFGSKWSLIAFDALFKEKKSKARFLWVPRKCNLKMVRQEFCYKHYFCILDVTPQRSKIWLWIAKVQWGLKWLAVSNP